MIFASVFFKLDFDEIGASFRQILEIFNKLARFCDGVVDVVEELDLLVIVEISSAGSYWTQVRFVDDFAARKILSCCDTHIWIVFNVDYQNFEFKKNFMKSQLTSASKSTNKWSI